MKRLFTFVVVLSFMVCTSCFAQIDIYQSDAYSVEEMCAREAEQSTALDYSEAYDACITKNGDNPIYQSGQDSADVRRVEEDNPVYIPAQDSDRVNDDSQYQSEEEFNQEQQIY